MSAHASRASAVLEREPRDALVSGGQRKTTQSVLAGNFTVTAKVTDGTPIVTVKSNPAAPEEAEGAGVVEVFDATVSDAARTAQRVLAVSCRRGPRVVVISRRWAPSVRCPTRRRPDSSSPVRMHRLQLGLTCRRPRRSTRRRWGRPRRRVGGRPTRGPSCGTSRSPESWSVRVPRAQHWSGAPTPSDCQTSRSPVLS